MPPPSHRLRPRYGRIAAAVASALVTVLTVLAGIGVLPQPSTPSAAADLAAQQTETPQGTSRELPAPTTSRPSTGTPAPDSVDRVDGEALPAGSGEGRRVVFSESRQRVWLVGSDDEVGRTYLVSGSTLDNLDPGTYEVYSRSRWAVGVDDSGVMQYFVRFTRGPSGAAIGFHTIPTKLGTPLQSASDLGTPQSHGCIRQRTSDAVALWHFAPLGTAVVVTA